MADQQITKLSQLNGTGLQANDPLAIADVSASETKKITAKDLVQASMDLIDNDSIPGGKIEGNSITAAELAADSVGSSELADSSVDTAALQANAVTEAKLAGLSVSTGKIKDDAVTGAKLGAVTDRGLDQTGDKIGHTNSVTAGTFAGIEYDAQGHIKDVPSSGEIPTTALPEATSSTIGAVKPGTGLEVTGDGTLNHSNSITGTDIGGLSFDDQGHCTGFPAGTPPVFERDAIPIAGDASTEVGGVFVPADADVGITVNQTTGELTHESSAVAAGTYAGVTVDDNGHVTAGTAKITEAQLPDEIPASDIGITDGTLPVVNNTPDTGVSAQGYTQAIANSSISRRHLGNTSIAYIQEAQPTSTASTTDATVFRGCLWFKESTGQLFMYNGNAWHIVAGGQLTQENLRFCGTYNASTNVIVALTDEGTAEQKEDGTTAFAVGSAIPSADDALSGCYFLIETAGSGLTVDNVNGNAFTVGDVVLAISASSGWVQISGSFGGGGGGGHWTRSGASPDAALTPTESADNLDLSGGDWLKLPQDSDAGGPPSNTEGTVRWNPNDNFIQVWDGSAWVSNAKSTNLQWETIAAADNDDWANNVLRPKAHTSDLALRPQRWLLFESGATTNAGDSGSTVSSLRTAAVTASRTWTLPDETGTVVTTVSTVDGADTLTIDCGTY